MSRDYENFVQASEQQEIREEQKVALISMQEFLQHIGLEMVAHESVKDTRMDKKM